MENPAQVLVLQHANCNDGAVAGVIAEHHYKKQFKSVLRMEAHYDAKIMDNLSKENLEAVTHVVIVDYSFKLVDFQLLLELIPSLQYVIWLDHHANDMNRDYQALCKTHGVRYEGVYDINRSGASITWDYFNPGVERPLIVNLAEDRDLWRLKLSDSTAFAKGLTASGYCPELRDDIILTLLTYPTPETAKLITKLISRGEGILNLTKTIACKYYNGGSEADSALYYMGYKRGNSLLLISESRELFSDIANDILDRRPDVVVVMNALRRGDTFHLEFRSRKSDEDISCKELAERFGGGGHKTAAGARFTHDSPHYHEYLRFCDAVDLDEKSLK